MPSLLLTHIVSNRVHGGSRHAIIRQVTAATRENGLETYAVFRVEYGVDDWV